MTTTNVMIGLKKTCRYWLSDGGMLFHEFVSNQAGLRSVRSLGGRLPDDRNSLSCRRFAELNYFTVLTFYP